MSYILVIILVFNGRNYHEQPVRAEAFATRSDCMAEQAKYPTTGVKFEKAECVPLVQR